MPAVGHDNASAMLERSAIEETSKQIYELMLVCVNQDQIECTFCIYLHGFFVSCFVTDFICFYMSPEYVNKHALVVIFVWA